MSIYHIDWCRISSINSITISGFRDQKNKRLLSGNQLSLGNLIEWCRVTPTQLRRDKERPVVTRRQSENTVRMHIQSYTHSYTCVYIYICLYLYLPVISHTQWRCPLPSHHSKNTKKLKLCIFQATIIKAKTSPLHWKANGWHATHILQWKLSTVWNKTIPYWMLNEKKLTCRHV